MRERRVVLVVLFLVIGYWLLGNFFPIHAQQSILSVTATVEPSPLWIDAINRHSQVTLETQDPEILKPVRIYILSKGFHDEIIPNQKIKIKIVDDINSRQEATLLSRQDGMTEFTFIPTHYGNYVIKAENITYGRSIPLIPLLFLIQKKESLLNLVLKLFEQRI